MEGKKRRKTEIFEEWKSPKLDPFFTDYHRFWSNVEGGGIPIVIDNGSHQCRVGWAAEEEPRMIFRSLVAKSKTKQGDEIYVGNDIEELESSRLGFRSPFDSEVVTNFELQELILDHSFLHLGLPASSSRVNHPLLITEPICNPSYSRKFMAELLFECYQVPSTAFGIDAIFSYHYNKHKGLFSSLSSSTPTSSSPSSTFIVRSGHHSTHLIPILDDEIQFQQLQRLSVGGSELSEFMMKLMHLKYPFHRASVPLTRAQELKEKYGRVAKDYTEELNALYYDFFNSRPFDSSSISVRPLPSSSAVTNGREAEEEEEEEEEKVVTIQLPMPIVPQGVVLTEEEKAQKHQARREQGLRLKDMAEQRRKGLREENEKRFKELQEVKEFKATITSPSSSTPSSIEKQYKKKLETVGFKSEQAFEKEWERLSQWVAKQQKRDKEKEREERKRKLGEAGEGEVLLEDEEEGEEESAMRDEVLYPLLNIPDEQLTVEQKAEKKKQRFLKFTREGRKKAKIQRQEAKQQQALLKKQEDDRRAQNPELYLAELKEQRQKLLDKKEERRKEKEASSGRRGMAAKKRMRLLTQAAFNDKGEDKFGESDADWNVYLSMTTEQDNETEQEEEVRLMEIEAKLREFGGFEPSMGGLGGGVGAGGLKQLTEEDYQLHLGVERIRVPEAMFQPSSILGIDQMGIGELLSYLLGQFKSGEQQQRLSERIFLTGGNTLYPGLLSRIEREVMCIRPFGSRFQVYRARDPLLDTWRGASLFARDGVNFPRALITKELYDEYGSEYFRSHFASNYQERKK